MFGFLKPKTTETLVAHLPTCLTDEDRKARFDAPVEKMLKAEGLGAVTRAVSNSDASGKVSGVEVEMVLSGLDAKKFDRLVAHFDALGAPKGSWFTDASGQEKRRFGTTEVVVLELDGKALPEGATPGAVGAELLAPIEEKVSSAGRLAGGRKWPETLELYFHCRSPRIVEAALADLLMHHPLCANARVFRLAA